MYFMATHLARVYFPDGKILYANYSTVVEQILSRLYSQWVKTGELSASGMIADRNQVDGEPEPYRADAPRSHPDALIPVTIAEEPDNRVWAALYCPSRLELIGPFSPHNTDHIQTTYELVSDDRGLLHLTDSHEFSSTIQAVCRAAFLGKVVPFHQEYCWPGRQDRPERLPERDLYAEWNTGEVCRECLGHPHVLDVEAFWRAEYKRGLESPIVPS